MGESVSQADTPSEDVLPLAKRDDFTLGLATIRPSLRTIEGPAGSRKVEPRVMQVLVALADACGRVLSRDDLLRICWDGRIVGDDAVNRAVAELRRTAAAVKAGFEVETVPRIGYRLTGADFSAGAEESTPTRVNRRALLGWGALGVAAFSGGTFAFLHRHRSAQVDALVEQGRLLQGSGAPDGRARAQALFRQAIALDPDRADAWGWLAVVLDDGDRAREAAQRALALDPMEPNARTLIAFQRRDLDSWTGWEDALLAVLADSPNCAAALDHLTLFYQGMGRCADSWNTNERAIRIEPFNPSFHQRRALKHWIFGRLGEADRVADQGLQLWPRDSYIWNARMVIFAFSGRGQAGLALLDDPAHRPPQLTDSSVTSWRALLTAVATRSPGDIHNALEVCTRLATLAPGLAANAIMAFSWLGQLDAAYNVADGLFEKKGPVLQQRHGIHDLYSGPDWGRTQFLFIPATSAFRADTRFSDLCLRLGHVAYWKRRGIWPDPFVRGSVDPVKLG